MENTPPLLIGSHLKPPQISTDLLVLETSWEAWIPENYVPLHQFSINGSWQRAESAEEKASSNRFGLLLSKKTPKINKDSEKNKKTGATYDLPIVRDTLLLRLFGSMRLGKNIFSRPEQLLPRNIESPIELDSRAIRNLSRCPWEDPQSPNPLSHIVIFHLSASSYTNVGWNLCTQNDARPIFIVYGNVLEASRWLILLVTCILSIWFLSPYRLFRVGLCGSAAVSCMLVPLVWTPICSGVFLGAGCSFIYSSIRRHLQYNASKLKPFIIVGKKPEKKSLAEKLASHPIHHQNTPQSVPAPPATEIPEIQRDIGTKLRVPGVSGVSTTALDGKNENSLKKNDSSSEIHKNEVPK